MRPLFIFFLLIINLIVSHHAAYANIYKWVDEKGQIHYTDKPVNDASLVEFKNNTENNVTLSPIPKLDQTSLTKKDKPVHYKIEIIKPIEEETIRNNQGNLSVKVSIVPKPPAQSQLQLYLNQRKFGEPQKTSVFKLTNINRGEHKITISLLDKNGKVLASSLPRTIFLHRAIKNKTS